MGLASRPTNMTSLRTTNRRVPSRLLAGIVRLAALASAGLFIAAASVYPGGNHFDARASGHDFWKNALCDVARTTAVGGVPNVLGAALARAAMTIMAIGIGAFFWLLPRRFPSSPRLGACVRVLGTVTVPATIAVVLLPADRFSALHGIAIVIAGPPGLTAALLATIGLAREDARSRSFDIASVLAVVTLCAASACFAVYVEELIVGGPSRLAVPILERIATLFLVAWMLTASSHRFEQRRAHLCRILHSVE